MVEGIKNLFKTKANSKVGQSQQEGADRGGDNQFALIRTGETYHDAGFRLAGQTLGDLNSFGNYLLRIIATVREKQKRDQDKQEAFRRGLRADIAKLKTKGETIEKDLVGLEKRKAEQQDKINTLQLEIADITKGHGGFEGKLAFWIGLVILVCLSFYLFLFYSSASYSAFFRTFGVDDTQVTQAIFDAQALTKAWVDGMAELMLILTIPFVFLAMGFLIHKFQEREHWSKYLQITAIITVAFAFDALLAYEICHKIYELKAANSFAEMPSYTVGMALEDVNFWIIIFSGFLVYIVWGFIFDFIIEEYDAEKLLHKKTYKQRKQIEFCQKEIERIDTDSQNKQKELNDILVETATLEAKLENTFWIDPKEMEVALREFTDGWLVYIANTNLPSAPYKALLDDKIQQLNS